MKKETFYLYLYFFLMIGFCVYIQFKNPFIEQMTTINDDALQQQFEQQIGKLKNMIDKLEKVENVLSS